ncbi:MAG: hypothetical protein WD063_12915 [Pirellulales bacterium]
MATDLFEQLAELEVPPPPDQFDQQLHERVNRSLVCGQLVDLGVSGMPWALAHFARALVGFLTLTVTGRYESKTKHRRR